MSNYATKSDWKNAIGIDTSKFAKETDLVSLKSDIDDLDTDKLKTVPVDLCTLSNVVEDDVVKQTVYDELIKKVNAIQANDTTDLFKKTGCNTQIDEIEKKISDHGKYITAVKFSTAWSTMFHEILKQAKLATNNDLNDVEQRSIKNGRKIEKLQTFNFFFLGKTFFGDNVFQNMFVFQPTLSTLELCKVIQKPP